MKHMGSTLNLNGYTLFVDGNVDIEHVDVNPPGTNKPGCIVATGDVKFWPNQNTGDINNGVFVMCLGSAGAEVDCCPEWRPGQEW
jgi:hypothetical protein